MSNKKRVLYVDDEPINLMLFELNFKSNFDIITSESAKEGLEILKKQNVSIEAVISDMRMPLMDGIEFIKEAYRQFPAIQYYMLTGYGTTPKIKTCIDKGVIKACFQKPFNKTDIINTIEKTT